MQSTSAAQLRTGLQQYPYASIFGIRLQQASAEEGGDPGMTYSALVPDPLSLHAQRIHALRLRSLPLTGSHAADQEAIPTEVADEAMDANHAETDQINQDDNSVQPSSVVALRNSTPSHTLEAQEVFEAPLEQNTANTASTEDAPATQINQEKEDAPTFTRWLNQLDHNLSMTDRPKRVQTSVSYTSLLEPERSDAIGEDTAKERSSATPETNAPEALEESFDDAKYQSLIYDSILLDSAIASPHLVRLLREHGHTKLAEEMQSKLDQDAK